MNELIKLNEKRQYLGAELDKTKAERERTKAEIAKLQEAANASLAKVALNKLPGAATRQAEQKVKAEALAIQAEELDRRVARLEAEIAKVDEEILAAQRAVEEAERLAAFVKAADLLVTAYPSLIEARDKHQAFMMRYGANNTTRPPFDIAGLIGMLEVVMRQQRIKEAVKKNSRQKVGDLAKSMALPDLTVKRELQKLGLPVVE